MALWIKVDVDFFDHPKVAAAGPIPAFFFLKMVAYCKRLAPDGLVPKVVDLGRLQTAANIRALVAAGLLHDEGTAWRVHDYTAWQAPSSEVSAKRSAAGAKGAARRWQPDGKPDGNCHPTNDGKPGGKPIANTDSKPIAESETESETEIRELHSSVGEQPTPTGPPDGEGQAIRTVFAHWVSAMGRDPRKTKLDRKRSGKIRARLREGRTVGELCAAIDGCRSSSWHMGDNADGKRFDELELILRDAAHVERFSGQQPAPEQGATQRQMANWMDEVRATRAAAAERMRLPA